ncbi:aspartate aminotransferase family protein [Marivibrio halodurans]|uniref:Aspartate aminotransferase family protein n=1 Tax=Marivibrio halodurans TaxID=2039722 RepID=A0A8J7S4X9_9PROT|nr:aspartate aminotransferase family protein [Marivibrio halodurans]MBP5856824.1 aspartate aminotransferase family protein [Marivibrio halodurans]
MADPESPTDGTVADGPTRGNSPAAKDVAHILHPYTNAVAHGTRGPTIMRGGGGIRVTDDAGKDYIEGMSGLWCAALGFGEERLIEAATRQMRELPFYHLFSHKSHDPAIDLAERLIAMAPSAPGGPMDKVFFANSGSEANDTAIKLIWYYNNARGRPEKRKIISRLKGYHGVTVATASLTGLPYNHRDFNLPIADILHTGSPHHYAEAEAGESAEDFATRRAEELDALIESEGPETVAAMFVEPVMGAGGVLVPPPTYFEKIQKVLRKHDVLLVADEVICGFGRTGAMFGCETFDIRPDMVSVAKALSAAYMPISAVMISGEIADMVARNTGKIGTFGHGYTYSGHPVAAAVALETLKIYEERDILGHVRAVAPALQEGLRRRFLDHPLVGEVRGVGLLGAVQMVADKANGTPFDPARGVGVHCAERAHEHGLIIRPVPGDGIAFCPPLIITEAEIGEMLDRFARALDDTARWLERAAA